MGLWIGGMISAEEEEVLGTRTCWSTGKAHSGELTMWMRSQDEDIDAMWEFTAFARK